MLRIKILKEIAEALPPKDAIQLKEKIMKRLLSETFKRTINELQTPILSYEIIEPDVACRELIFFTTSPAGVESPHSFVYRIHYTS